MIFDVDAVKQLVRHYNGFYLVKGGCTEERLQYKTVKDNDCQVDIDCSLGEVTVTLQEEYRGRNSVTKKTLEYNYIHEIMNDPRLIFMDEVVKPVKRRKSTDTNKNEPLPTFSISAFKDPLKSKPSSILSASPSLPVRPSFKPKPFGGGFDLGGDLGGLGPRVPSLDLGSDLGGLGPRVPSLGPKKELTRVEKLKAAEEAKQKSREKEDKTEESTSGSSPVKATPVHQDLLAMDYLYKTKTKNELNFLKRQIEKDVDSTEKKAKLNHKQNIEKYNKYLAAIPEQNELRRINWHKH